MTIRYLYACKDCGKEYVEQRLKDDPQYFVNCMVCNGEFKEIETIDLDETLAE